MREWLRETHGVQFELIRHFLRRFFESEMIASPEHTRSALIGGGALLLPWFQVLYSPLKEKYAHLAGLAAPGPYRGALLADELWLITLVMSAIGLLAAVKWQSMFPDLRDYRVLGSLPLRARQIFLAKFAALLLVSAAAMAAITAFPAAALPAVAASPWAPKHLGIAFALSAAAGCGFFVLALVALQGVLLNLLRPRAFRSVAGSLQGLLVALMLAMIVLSFSIQPKLAATLLQGPWARWLPPVWFAALCQVRSGNPDPAIQVLAHRGWNALLLVALAAVSTYAVSYRRHRTLLVEGGGCLPRRRRSSALLGWFLPDPRQQGVAGFMMSTLARSGHHRMVLMGYGGLALAIALSGLAAFGSFSGRERDVASGFVFLHIVAILAILIGARHLFSRPTELKANWLFQLTARESRGEWLRAVDRVVLSCASLVWLLPLPVELRCLGWRAIAEVALTVVGGLMLYDWVFSSWDKLPFTCSFVPGKTEGWMLALRFLAVAATMPFLQGLLFLALYNPWLYAGLFLVEAATWRRFHSTRREGWSDLRLRFEDTVDPAVHGLNLLR
jgi:hypothetical protein